MTSAPAPSELGAEGSLVYQLSALNALFLKYTYSKQDIHEYKVGDISELDILSQVVSIAPSTRCREWCGRVWQR
jgi:hypothetical protein